MDYAIHWFRRDLRVAGNAPLQKLHKEFDGKVVGLFTFDHAFLGRKDFSYNRFQLFLHTLHELQKELRELGSDLLVLDVGPEAAMAKLFADLRRKKIDLPQVVSFNRDYEPFARKRDKKIASLLQAEDIECRTERDHLLIEPEELEKAPGEGYQVYSPFARKWLEIFQEPKIFERVQMQKPGLRYLGKRAKGTTDKIFSLSWKKLLAGKLDLKDVLQKYIDDNKKSVTIELPEAGSQAAFKCLQNFKKHVDEYGGQRDFPAVPGTSRLSMYLKNGSITVSQIIAYFDLEPYKKKKSSRDVFFSELIWREFYYHILWRHPHVEKRAFLEKYADLDWQNDKRWFQAWKDGMTGYPIVDAGMRELKHTGWMHNRVRMIVASFLTKDLLIDWQWGERYFMEALLDGDLAPNNGGWQWAASTGCDPQPYFRIFNPWLQSKKFDADGDYIRTYIPELADLPTKELHQPVIGHATYPEPIVAHDVQRALALKMYKI